MAHPRPQGTYFTSHAIAKLIRVSPSTVLSWIDRGLLPAHRTPGGHRRVRHDDLVAFLEQRALPIPSSLGGARRVLLVGFDERTRRGLGRRAPELEIHAARDLLDGLLELGARRPEALVLDADRADSGDPSVIGRIRGQPSMTAVPVIVVGSFATSHERVALFHEAGASACLAKPLKLDVLIRTLGLASPKDG